MNTLRRFKLLYTFPAILCLLTSCSSVRHPSNPEDPYEGYNRKVYAFNTGVDKVVYRPLAKLYDTVTPSPVRKGVTNFFVNVNEIPSVANSLLQFNMPWFFTDTSRFVINTTLGVGGLFDVAKHMGLAYHPNDFGLTMAKWGVRESPYFLLPFFAPGTARDQFAFFVNYYMTPYPYVRPWWLSNSVYALYLIDLRASFLPADKLVEQAFDPYIFMRDAYLQKRKLQIQQVLHPNENIKTKSLTDVVLSGDVDSSGTSSSTTGTGTGTSTSTGSNSNPVNVDEVFNEIAAEKNTSANSSSTATQPASTSK